MPPPLHPELAAAAAQLREAGIERPAAGGLAETRAWIDAADAFAARASVPLAGERPVTVAGPHGPVPCKLYPAPDEAEVSASALLFYCHGGGFRQGSLAGWDAALRELARAGGISVLSIGYRLAPEHRFPVAFDEVGAVMRAVMAANDVDGLAADRFAAGGDSAGANLALGATLALRDAGLPPLAALLLIYGVYALDTAAPEWDELGGFGLSAAAMRSVWAGYLGDGAIADGTDWRIEPLRADLRGLPSTRLVIGDLDPLIGQNRALDACLRQAGVPATLTVLTGVNHGVVRLAALAPVVAAMLATEGAALRDLLARAAAPLTRAG